MTTKDTGGSECCAWCDRRAHIRQGRILLCVMHYRISSMRARAKRDGKMVPTREQIEGLAAGPMVCGGCGEAMSWLRGFNASKQATLQHDRDGGIRLLCLGCNTRHSLHPDDSFYALPAGHKRCPDCEKVLPHSAFTVDRSRPIGLKSYCRGCSAIRHKNWRQAYAVS